MGSPDNSTAAIIIQWRQNNWLVSNKANPDQQMATAQVNGWRVGRRRAVGAFLAMSE